MITKQSVQSLIEKLVNKELTFGCKVEMTFEGEESDIFTIYNADNDGSVEFCETECSVFLSDSYINDTKFRILGHPIHLHDVLEKLDKESLYTYARWDSDLGVELGEVEELVSFWFPCGIKKSLQEILGEAEWEEVECIDPDCKNCPYKTVMKPSPIADLFAYLLTLFPDE